MSYEKPRRSAGMITGSVAAGVSSVLIRWFGAATSDATALTFAWIALLVAAVLLVVGLWRFFEAFDAAALDRWRTVKAEEDEKLRQAADRHKADAGTGGE